MKKYAVEISVEGYSGYSHNNIVEVVARNESSARKKAMKYPNAEYVKRVKVIDAMD